MNEVSFKNRLGIFLVLAHFGILTLVVVLWLNEYYLKEQMTTAISIIAPFFATYTTAIIKYMISGKNQRGGRGRVLSEGFVFIGFLVPLLFVSFVASAVILKAYNIGLKDFEDFKIMLGTAETIFGVYVGQLIFSLFEQPKAAEKPEDGGAR